MIACKNCMSTTFTAELKKTATVRINKDDMGDMTPEVVTESSFEPEITIIECSNCNALIQNSDEDLVDAFCCSSCNGVFTLDEEDNEKPSVCTICTNPRLDLIELTPTELMRKIILLEKQLKEQRSEEKKDNKRKRISKKKENTDPSEDWVTDKDLQSMTGEVVSRENLTYNQDPLPVISMENFDTNQQINDDDDILPFAMDEDIL